MQPLEDASGYYIPATKQYSDAAEYHFPAVESDGVFERDGVLDSLPPELILCISDFLLSADLTCFLLSCRQLYQLLLPQR